MLPGPRLRRQKPPLQLSDPSHGPDHGRIIAALLRHIWRENTADEQLNPEHVAQVSSLLLGSGVAPLVHRRLNLFHGSDARFPALRDAARMSVLQAALRTRRAAEVVGCFRAAGIEPLLGKGWAVAARYYADPSLRPSSDIDLFVAPHELRAATELHQKRAPELAGVDLHGGCSELCDLAWSSVVDQRIELPADHTSIFTFSDAHHLRLLCLHFAKHAGFRSLWLCDVAALIERCAPGLDWDEVLRGDRWRSRWVLGIVALARDLLGANVSGTPAERVRVPPWVTAAVLREWQTPSRWPNQRAPVSQAIASGRLRDIAREFRARYPSPIEASFNFRGPFNGFPRLPFEILQGIRQSFALPRQLFYSFIDRRSDRSGAQTHE